MQTKLQKVAFLDRDGTLIFEPPDTKQIDSLDDLRILQGVVPVLQSLIEQGYKLVMVSNQDGLGTTSFPQDAFDVVQTKLLNLFFRKSISFERIYICPHFQDDICACRKPKTGLLTEFLRITPIDWDQSFMVGDRNSDALFAENIGVRCYLMETNGTFPDKAKLTYAQ